MTGGRRGLKQEGGILETANIVCIQLTVRVYCAAILTVRFLQIAKITTSPFMARKHLAS